MSFAEEEITALFKKSLNDVGNYELEEVGRVISYSDGICTIHGLYNSFIGEEVIFDSGSTGIVFDLDDEICYVFVLISNNILSGEGIRRTKNFFKINTSEKLLGRVINSLGNEIDGLGKINEPNITKKYIEAPIPGISERQSISKSLQTGILVIDSLIPIGKGQRQLLIGNRNTGKTVTAIDTIVKQKNTDTICIYVSIGQQEASVAKIKEYLIQNDALKNTVIVSSNAASGSIHNYLAPYVGTTIAEYFAHEKKRDVLIIYDDLSNHAISYREMSLLMKRSPARDAYPGDIFYLHARLLERSGNFTNGSSITSLPIVQIQEDDLSAYIPTNLISITDGQVYFDTKLFNSGIKPAINTELSVSRVGGAAQTKLINKLSKALRLDLAQYHELSVFSQFGSELDEASLDKLKKGSILMSLLIQKLGKLYSVADEAIILYVFRNWYKQIKNIENITEFIEWLIEFIKSTRTELYETLNSGEILIENEILRKLDEIILECITIFPNNN